VTILILGMNYAPESTGIGPYTSEFAEFLSDSGHEVHVIAAPPHFPQWVIREDYRRSIFRTEIMNGVHVHRVYTYVPGKPRKVINRLLYDSIFSTSVLVRALFVKRADVVFAVSPPVQLGLTAWMVSRLHRAFLFFHVQDIVSRAAVGTGMVRASSMVSRIARRMESAVHQCADAIGVICNGFETYLKSVGVPGTKIIFFPNYVDTGVLQPGPRSGLFRTLHKVSERDFVVMYSGGIAQKQGLETLVAAAENARQFRFFIIGEGPSKGDLERGVAARNLTNVTILPLQPKATLAQQLCAADVLVLTQKRNVTDAVFPSKLLTYMACERPIVAAVAEESETARFIRQYDVGLVVPPEDPAALASALVKLREDPALAARLARNARCSVMATFEKRVVLQRMRALLTQQPLTPLQ
jgi:putative colanic acid biosynthesis glycosyltransferase WcaI